MLAAVYHPCAAAGRLKQCRLLPKAQFSTPTYCITLCLRLYDFLPVCLGALKVLVVLLEPQVIVKV